MGVSFFEGRTVPAHLRQLSGYGDAWTGIADIVQKASPWDFLTGVFVTKPMAQAADQLAAQQLAAQAQEQQDFQRGKTTRTMLYIGAGALGILALVLVMKPSRAPAKVAGYRRRKRR